MTKADPLALRAKAMQSSTTQNLNKNNLVTNNFHVNLRKIDNCLISVSSLVNNWFVSHLRMPGSSSNSSSLNDFSIAFRNSVFSKTQMHVDFLSLNRKELLRMVRLRQQRSWFQRDTQLQHSLQHTVQQDLLRPVRLPSLRWKLQLLLLRF